jgi:hypothetical protein
MNEEVDQDLTFEERTALQELPRKRAPSRLLEERVVRALRDESLLGPTRALWRRPRLSLMVASVAASLVLFAGGIAVGHWMGTRSTAQAFLAVREQDAALTALRVQEAGTAYVEALAALGELAGGLALEGNGRELDQGVEAALVALYAAAFELARISPDDGDIARIVQLLEEQGDAAGESRAAGAQQFIWF